MVRDKDKECLKKSLVAGENRNLENISFDFCTYWLKKVSSRQMKLQSNNNTMFC
jgi:hypothetical protein